MIDEEKLARAAHARFVAVYGRMPNADDDTDHTYLGMTARERNLWRPQDASPTLDIPDTVIDQAAHEAVRQGRKDSSAVRPRRAVETARSHGWIGPTERLSHAP